MHRALKAVSLGVGADGRLALADVEKQGHCQGIGLRNMAANLNMAVLTAHQGPSRRLSGAESQLACP